MKRLWVVYNPRSSHHAAVEAEVLKAARGVSGFLVGKYEVKKASVDENAKLLAGMLGDGDLVIAAGGDGTATMVANAVLESGKEAVFSAIGYGNLNDMAQMLKVRRPVEYGGEYVGGVQEIVEKFQGSVPGGSGGSGSGSGGASAGASGGVVEVYPLEVLVDGEHWRYAMCYATVGLLAEATEMMDEEGVRARLNTGRRGVLYSLVRAVFWYLGNKGRRFLPGAEVSGSEGGEVVVKLNGEVVAGATDYLAVNGPRVAKMMKGGKWYLSKEKFGSGVKSLGKFWKMVGFGLRSITLGIKLAESEGDVLEFSEPSEVEIQAEGEYQRLSGVRKIEVRKVKRGMKVVVGK